MSETHYPLDIPDDNSNLQDALLKGKNFPLVHTMGEIVIHPHLLEDFNVMFRMCKQTCILMAHLDRVYQGVAINVLDERGTECECILGLQDISEVATSIRRLFLAEYKFAVAKQYSDSDGSVEYSYHPLLGNVDDPKMIYIDLLYKHSGHVLLRDLSGVMRKRVLNLIKLDFVATFIYNMCRKVLQSSDDFPDDLTVNDDLMTDDDLIAEVDYLFDLSCRIQIEDLTSIYK